MDFGDFESRFSNLFGVAHISENIFSQDAQHRLRRSSRKKLRVTRTPASLVIDQLKNGFRRPGDFTPRMRTRRNWRPEFLMKCLREYYNRSDCNEKRIVMQHREKYFVPETPKIYSIGLRSETRGSSDKNDLWRLYSVTRNFKRRFDIVFRPMFICKYWVEKSSPTSSSILTSTDISPKTQKNCQTAVIDCTESTNIFEHERIPKNNYDQSYECNKEKSSDISDSLRNDYATVDSFFISNDFKDSSVSREYRSCLTRDAQIQTSSRKSSRRKKPKKRLKLTNEGISHYKYRRNKPRGRIIADYRVDSHNSNKRNRYEKSRLCVQVLENKRVDYINKFTAVNRQIEEITATLRETCYNDNNSRSNLENYEEYFSSISNDAKVNQKSNEIESKFMIARGENKKMNRKDNLKENINRIIRECHCDCQNNMLEILHAESINDELLDPSSREYFEDTVASLINPPIKLNDIFTCDSTRAFSIDKTVYSLNRNSENKKKEKCCFVEQILNNNNCEKNLVEDFSGLEKFRYRKRIIGEKIGEIAILEDIKKRIDRDFDDRSAEKAENDTENFLTVSQKSSNFDRLFSDVTMEDLTSAKTIEKSKSTSLIISGSSSIDINEVQVRDSISADAMSEYSNKNSTLSEYFSCKQFPSIVSFAENEDELDPNFENHNITVHNCSDSLSNYYDCSRSNLNLNNFTHSNMNTSFDRSFDSNSDCAADYISANKFSIEAKNVKTDALELSMDRESIAKDSICERLLGVSKKKEKEFCIEFEKRHATDSTFETSKSSRYIGSIDSGVFSSSMNDLYSHESPVNKSMLKKKRRVEKHDESSPLSVDFNSDSTDDTLDRRVDDVVRDLTEKLILCERRMKFKKMRKMGYKTRDARYYSRQITRTWKFNRSPHDAYCDFNSPRFNENERIVSISTPTLLSLSDSEIENRNESIC